MPQGVQQQAVQVGAVHAQVGRAVAPLARLAEGQARQLAAVVRAAHAQHRRAGGDARQARRQAEGMQPPRDIGAELDAGADLAEGGRLLQHLDAMPLARQRQGGSQPADAGAGDEDLQAHWITSVLRTAVRAPFGTAGRMLMPE